jgi:hypothetical protein
MHNFEITIARVLEQSRLYFGLNADGNVACRATDDGWGERRIEDDVDGEEPLPYQLLPGASRRTPGIDLRACA